MSDGKPNEVLEHFIERTERSNARRSAIFEPVKEKCQNCTDSCRVRRRKLLIYNLRDPAKPVSRRIIRSIALIHPIEAIMRI
ncbi:unnamed protein product [Heterobilharzia americana]|nr:unnamed protein product [Heterobilharzia americana]